MNLVLLWAIAALMAVFTAWLVKRGSTMRTLNDASILLFLLTMMATMFISAVVYFYYPGFTTLIILVAFNMVSMSIFLIPVLSTLLFGDRPLEEMRKGSAISTRALVDGSVIALVILSEVFMGWTFAMASRAIQTVGGFQAVYSAIVVSSSSYWFVFTMASEMAITFSLMRTRFRGGIGRVIAAQPVIMLLAPTAIDNQGWAYFSFLAGSIVMTGLLVYLVKYLNENRNLSSATLGYLICLISTYALMMAGLIIWFINSDASLFVLSLLVEMTIYFYVVLEDKKLGSRRSIANFQSPVAETSPDEISPRELPAASSGV